MKNEKLENELKKLFGDDEWHIKYWMSETSAVVELENNEIHLIQKQKIQTSFCFGYGYCGISDEESENNAYKMANHAKTQESYFINQNLKFFDARIKELTENEEVYTCRKYFDNEKVVEYITRDAYRFENMKVRKLSDTEKEKLLEAYKTEKAKMEKRLNTYLKRYGLSKIKSWSYLSD